MSERLKKAIVISPHQDDAAISLSSTLASRYDHAHMVNVFTRSDSTILDIEPEVDLITQVRTDEDAAFVSRYGYSAINGGFPDSELRGVAWDNQTADVDQGLLNEVSAWIKQQLDNSDGPFDLFIPAAFGLHPDHYIAMIAALKMDSNRSICVYAEQPYFADASGYHKGHYMLTQESQISVPNQNKREALELYPSQLSNERVERLSDIEAEYYWQLGVGDRETFLKLARLRNDQGELHIFGNTEWVERIKQSYESSNRRFMEFSLPAAGGETLSMPICIDTMDVPDVGKVNVARHASIYTSDYLVAGDETGFNKLSYDALREAALNAGADAVLLSNIRVGGPLHDSLLAELETRNNATTLENVGSVGLICESTYNDWYSSQSKNMRRNIRRKLDRLSEVAQEDGDKLYFELAPLTVDSLSTLLNNQARRAETTELNAYSEDKEFARFLGSLIGIQGVQIAELQIGKEIVSSLLVLAEPERKAIGIYLQSFSEKWAQYSPSFCAIVKLIEYAHDHGYIYVDFLRGEEAYKDNFVNYRVNMVKFLDQLNLNIDHTALRRFFDEYEE